MDDIAPMVRRTEQSLSVILGGEFSRNLARGWVDAAPTGWVISVTKEPRSLGQSDFFWTICSRLAQSSVTWDDEKQSKQGWHDLLMHGWMIATNQAVRLSPGLEGGRVSLGLSSRRLGKEQMTSLLDYSIAWATGHGIEVEVRE